MRLFILRAEGGQAGELTQIAQTAKRYWGYPEAWMEAWRPLLTITLEQIAAWQVYRAVQAGETLGFYALAGRGQDCILEHLWVKPQVIGKGVGRALFEHAVEKARELGASRLEIESDPHAEGFYRKMGAKRSGEHLTHVLGEPRFLPVLVVDL
jgi:GNAT superfamily N-acetyltransferase